MEQADEKADPIEEQGETQNGKEVSEDTESD